jgi:predicted nucleotide-binding protein
VHGHDEAAKEVMARFVERLGLTPVILHEQPSSGNTIIEKLLAHMDVDFTLVLLTPDDVGSLVSTPSSLKSRARQNVVFELGLFVGALGRKKVCALYKGDVELPSDYQGVLYVPMDDAGGWKLLLAREMRHAGLDIDMNKAV